MIEHQMQHLNSNALCAIWVETTGADPRKCDIVEICIMLVDNFIRHSQKMMPYYQQITPYRPENIDFETSSFPRAKLIEITRTGLDPSMAADRLEEWHQELDLPHGKKIIPLTFNWPNVREYLHTWLQFNTFNSIFSHQYRDVMSTALHINDCKNQQARQYPYPRPDIFTYLCNMHDIEVSSSCDVMVKCLKLIDLYRAMLQVHF